MGTSFAFPTASNRACWRPQPSESSDAFHLQLVQRVLADGFAFVTSTTLRVTTSLRMCTINPRTTDSDIVQTLAKLSELAADPSLGRYLSRLQGCFSTQIGLFLQKANLFDP